MHVKLCMDVPGQPQLPRRACVESSGSGAKLGFTSILAFKICDAAQDSRFLVNTAKPASLLCPVWQVEAHSCSRQQQTVKSKGLLVKD